MVRLPGFPEVRDYEIVEDDDSVKMVPYFKLWMWFWLLVIGTGVLLDSQKFEKPWVGSSLPFIQVNTTSSQLNTIIMVFSFLPECDGMVSTSNDVYEPDLNAAFRQWFNERKKPTYFIGPIIPSDSVSTSRDFGIPSNVENVQTFLDKVLNNHGRRSMLYVRSFLCQWSELTSI